MPKPETVARQLSKERIVRIAQKGGDWKVVADALEVNYKTAWLWVSQARKNDLLETPPAPKLPWGGKRAEKIKREHLDFLESLIADNCFITLREMAEALFKEFGLKVVQQTIQKRLHCHMYSLRKVSSVQDQFVNLEQQKLARRMYALTLERLKTAGKRIFFIDETNYNIWCAKKMERCRNLHVLACLSEDGVALWEHASGALKPEEMNAFIHRALDKIAGESESDGERQQVSLADVVLVIDNAPCYASIEEVFADAKYREVALVRLPLFSPMLNPCDSVFANFRGAAKQFLHANEQQLITAPDGTTVIEHRTSFLVRAAEELFPQAATPEECAKSFEQTRALTQEALRADDVDTAQKTAPTVL